MAPTSTWACGGPGGRSGKPLSGAAQPSGWNPGEQAVCPQLLLHGRRSCFTGVRLIRDACGGGLLLPLEVRVACRSLSLSAHKS